jgi:hypothetical protein
MAKKAITIKRFDGGITSDIRNTSDLSKCAFVSHFDIYSDPYKLIPMPGYVADMNDGSTATGMKQYNIKAFCYNGTMYAVGTKTGGADCKLFEKASPTTAAWTASTTGEGTYDIHPRTTMWTNPSGHLYWATTNAGVTYITRYAGTISDNHATLQSFALTTQPIVSEYAFDDNRYYNTGADDVDRLSGTTITDSAKDTSISVTDIQSGDEQVGLFGHRSFPYRSQLLLWDSASSLIDQKVELGKGIVKAGGRPSGTWVAVIDENMSDISSAFQEEANGKFGMSIKYVSGNSAETLLRFVAATDTNGMILPTRGVYKDAMLFYARIPQDATPTTYKQGIWAVGRRNASSPLAVSLLLDTTSLGSIQGYYEFGNHHYFSHAGDGSISRLGTTTYDVAAVYETLMFGSNELNNSKTFTGVSILTENLPSGGSVVLKYRTDEDSAWTTVGTSSTVGTQRHNFTSVSGVPIGEFREMQFRVEITGNAPMKEFVFDYEVLSDKP